MGLLSIWPNIVHPKYDKWMRNTRAALKDDHDVMMISKKLA
jgi:hypothetical protein